MRVTTLRWNRDDKSFAPGGATADATFGLYFGPNDVIADAAFQAAVRSACPGAHILGCTTGTCIDAAGLHDQETILVAVRLERTATRLVSRRVTVDTSASVGADLARALVAPDLAGVLVLSDSLNVEGAKLLDGMRSVLGLAIPISGGLASDGADFIRTLVGADGAPAENTVAALGFYGASVRMTQGCAHGWDNFGPPRRITKSAGPVLFELDGKPALDLYEHYLGEYAAELPASALRFPLLVSDPADPSTQVIRTVLNIDRAAGSLSFAAGIPEGWNARLMRGSFDNLANGAGAAARQVVAAGETEGLALLVSCVGRRVVLGEHTGDEIEAVTEALSPTLKQVGFYSHGEISATPNDPFCGLHNQTMTIVTLQEAA